MAITFVSNCFQTDTHATVFGITLSETDNLSEIRKSRQEAFLRDEFPVKWSCRLPISTVTSTKVLRRIACDQMEITCITNPFVNDCNGAMQDVHIHFPCRRHAHNIAEPEITELERQKNLLHLFGCLG